MNFTFTCSEYFNWNVICTQCLQYCINLIPVPYLYVIFFLLPLTLSLIYRTKNHIRVSPKKHCSCISNWKEQKFIWKELTDIFCCVLQKKYHTSQPVSIVQTICKLNNCRQQVRLTTGHIIRDKVPSKQRLKKQCCQHLSWWAMYAVRFCFITRSFCDAS
jgi:hypothetical protein